MKAHHTTPHHSTNLDEVALELQNLHGFKLLLSIHHFIADLTSEKYSKT
jgi:hypothetical protein